MPTPKWELMQQTRDDHRILWEVIVRLLAELGYEPKSSLTTDRLLAIIALLDDLTA